MKRKATSDKGTQRKKTHVCGEDDREPKLRDIHTSISGDLEVNDNKDIDTDIRSLLEEFTEMKLSRIARGEFLFREGLWVRKRIIQNSVCSLCGCPTTRVKCRTCCCRMCTDWDDKGE